MLFKEVKCSLSRLVQDGIKDSCRRTGDRTQSMAENALGSEVGRESMPWF